MSSSSGQPESSQMDQQRTLCNVEKEQQVIEESTTLKKSLRPPNTTISHAPKQEAFKVDNIGFIFDIFFSFSTWGF
jgi:hypothetical protein